MQRKPITFTLIFALILQLFVFASVSQAAGGKMLPAPTGLTAGNVTDTGVHLSWNPVQDATSYRLKLNGQFAADSTGLSHTFNGLTPDTFYTFQVAPISKMGTVGDYASVTATTKLAAPAGLTATTVTATSATLAWNAVSGATGYQVTGNGIQSSPVEPTITLTDLNPNTAYTFEVKALSSVTGASNPASVNFTTPNLSAPTGLTVTEVTQTSATIQWDPVSDADKYQIKLNTHLVHTTANGLETSYTFTGLNDNTAYIFEVAAVADNGAVSDFAFVSAATPIAEPQGPFVLQEGTPLDVYIENPYDEVVTFTPTVTGVYKIYTGPYGGTAGDGSGSIGNDPSAIYLYKSPTQESNNLVALTNTRNSDGYFEISAALNAGQTYYVAFDTYYVQTRLTAELVTPLNVPVIHRTENVALNLAPGQSAVFAFMPYMYDTVRAKLGPIEYPDFYYWLKDDGSYNYKADIAAYTDAALTMSLPTYLTSDYYTLYIEPQLFEGQLYYFKVTNTNINTNLQETFSISGLY